jgi:hypothetical protein
LKAPVEEVLRAIVANTNIRVDSFVGAAYFATKRGVKFNWHQDHESYFLFQSHVNYLNLYIPVVKPHVDKSNLSVVPFDTLERESLETHRRTVRSGATTVHPMGTGQFLVHDHSGEGHATPLSFDRIAQTPQLSAGDLLVLRGDVFHKTQDSDTDRVAMSIRFAHSKTAIRRSTLADGGLYKSNMMVRNISDFGRAFQAFDLAGKEELSWGELQPLMGECSKRFGPISSPKLFVLRQKIRSRVVLSSVGKAANEIVMNPLKYLYHRRQQKKTSIGEHREAVGSRTT